MKLVSRNELSA